MSSEIVSGFKLAIEQSEKDLQELEKMIAIVQRAGEDTTALRAKLANTKAKIARYKSAIGGET